MSQKDALSASEHEGLWTVVERGVELVERRRRRRIAWTTSAAAVVLVAGLLTGVSAVALSDRGTVATPLTPTPMPTPTTTTSRTPTATPTPTPTAMPTATATPAPPTSSVNVPSRPETWLLSESGMGPLVLTMPFADAITAVDAQPDACGRGDGGVATAFPGPQYGPHLFMARDWGETPTDLLAVAGWYGEGGPRTDQGVGFGSTAAEVRAAYPGAVEVYRQRLNLKVGAMFFQIEDDGLVSAVGVTSGDIPYEYCG